MTDKTCYASQPIHIFLEKLARDVPALPGAGSALGLLGALAASLGAFVLKVSAKKVSKISFEQKQRCEELIRNFESFQLKCQKLMDADADAYRKVIEAFNIQGISAAGRSEKRKAIQDAFKEATKVPYELMKCSIDMLNYCSKSLGKSYKPVEADLAVAVETVRTCFYGALWIARANLGEIEDDEFVVGELEKYEVLRKKINKLYGELRKKLSEQI